MANLFGKKISALTYGQVKASKDVIDKVAASGLDPFERTEAAIDFLKVAFPEATSEDFDSVAPGALQMAALELYKATFARPEDDAPVPLTNP